MESRPFSVTALRPDVLGGLWVGAALFAQHLFLFLCGHPEACLSQPSDWWRRPGHSTIKIHGHTRFQPHVHSPCVSLSQCLFTFSGHIVMSDRIRHFSVAACGLCLSHPITLGDVACESPRHNLREQL